VPGDEAGSDCAQVGVGAASRAARRARAAPLRRSDELDSEQGRLLALLAKGLTLVDAAASLELSQRTAERRLAAARLSLGARTTAQAVVLAVAERQSPQRPFAELNWREREVLEAVGSGLTSREIGERLGTRASNVDALVRSAISKLHARTRMQAAVLAARPTEKLAGFIDEGRDPPA
jgi:DNA-binding NarL/FixJ family response regulator